MQWLTFHLPVFLVIMLLGKATWKFKLAQSKYVNWLTSFSGAYLLAVCILHLAPEVFVENSPSIGLFVLLGYLIQILLDYLSKGLEHGHIHLHKKEAFPWGVFISLCIHSLLEAMPVVHSHHGHEVELHMPLATGILVHKFPIVLLLVGLFAKSGVSFIKAMLLLAVFALTFPIGNVATIIVREGGEFFAHQLQPALQAIVLGILLHISTVIILETSSDHKYSAKKLALILIGFILAACISL